MLLPRLRQLAALALTVIVLLAIPYLLIAVITWPDPDLSWLSIQVHLRGGRLPPGVLTTVLLAALWGVWALYLVAVLAEAAAWLRRGPVRLRPLGPAQLLAATALGTVTTTSAGAAPALAETVVTAAHHEDTAAEQQADQASETAYEYRERDRTVSGFGYDSAQVTDQMRTDLASTVELIAQHGAPETPIVIAGHTDSAGDAHYNQELSQRRAQAMADYLRDQLGDQAPPIDTRGRGEEEPLADVDDAAQRRVQITYTITVPLPEEPAPEPTSSDDGEEPGALFGLSSGAVTGLAAGVAAAAGAAGGYALGARRRPAPHSAHEVGHRFPTTASSSSSPSTAAGTSEEPAGPVETGAPVEDDHEPQHSDTLPAIAPRVLAALTHSPGVGVEGPDAHGAARTLLATALTTADTDPEVRVVICAEDARHLLGEETTALLAERGTPGVKLADSFAGALTTVHATMVERQHQLDQADAEPLAQLRTHDPDVAPAAPPVILLARSHPDHEADLSGLLLAADGLDITAVILGRWLLGGTLTIEAGAITEASPPLAPLHGATWPTASAQHLHDLLNARPHRTPAAAPDPESPSSTTVNNAHQGERVPQPAAAAPAEVDQPAAAPPEPPDTGPPLDPPVEDTGPAAPESPPPEPGEPPPPAEDEHAGDDHPDDDHAEETARGEERADGHDGDAPSPSPGADEGPWPTPAPSPHEHGQRPIQVQLMSRIQITVDGARVEMPRRAAYELAAYLALHHDDGVRLERAITDMWPDEDPRRTTRRFHDAARTLRKTRAPRDDEDLGEPVARDGEIYRLNADVVAVDLCELQDALDEAEHTDELARRHSLLQTVARLYTGDLAAEADYPWILPVRTRLRHRVTQALRRHAETVAAEHPHVAAVVLERAVDIDPEDDDLHAALMRHHLHHGDPEAARRAFARYTDHMHRLGTHPNPRLRDLIEDNTA